MDSTGLYGIGSNRTARTDNVFSVKWCGGSNTVNVSGWLLNPGYPGCGFRGLLVPR